MGYLIRASFHYYADTIHAGRVRYFGRHGMDSTAPLLPFADHAAARAQADTWDSQTYLFGHGEYARPTLRAVPISQAPAWICDRVAAGL